MKRRLFILCILLFLLAACGEDDPVGDGAGGATVDSAVPTAASQAAVPATTAPAGGTESEAIAPTPVLTATPAEPVVATVNGTPIYESAWLREKRLIEAGALGLTIDGKTAGEAALDELIKLTLLEQAAAQSGIIISDEEVEQNLTASRRAVEEAGGASAFTDWLATNNMSEDDYRAVLRNELLVAAVSTAVTSEVPYAVEQVNARYIQVSDLATAQTIMAELGAGAEFATLAEIYSLDQVTAPAGGELGYFSRGTLLVPEVEAAAFALTPPAYSDIITVVDGSGTTTYYIVQTIAYEPERPLESSERNLLLVATWENWLMTLQTTADVQILIDVNAGS